LTALIVFIIGWSLIVYVYLGYPLLVTALAKHRTRSRKHAGYRRVTVLFCAHNEGAVLPEKIANCKALDFPTELLEFRVGSDGSTDGTNALLQAWAKNPRVHLTLSPDRVGKTALLNRIVPTAAGEIVLFSDASTLLPPDAVQRHVGHYTDSTVGCVGGDLVFVNAERSPVSGAHGAYWRYERYLRRCESSLGILACVAGANYSIRRALWRSVEPRFADDCNSPLNVIEQGYRVVYDPEASAAEVAAESSTGLMRRRVRMVTRDLEAILARPALLNPFRFPGVAWSLWSHKLLRWLGAPLLVMLLVSNLFLLHRPLFQATFGCQLVFYALSLVGYLLQGEGRSRWLSLPLYFSLSNLAALHGLANVLRRKPAVTWQPGGTT
jgi:poly-beta-1,6-N-acetyl-D-glucosamine synthase